MKVNPNYANLQDSYLFSGIRRRIKAFLDVNPEAKLIRLGVGDVTRPLPPAVVEALSAASQEMGDAATFRGYGEEQGCVFLRSAIAGYYAKKGVTLDETEIFISDGAKSDLANILDIFSESNTVAVPDPVYPVYVDTNIMAGRRLVYLRGTPENGFLPTPPVDLDADIVYLCTPNNPTGAVYTKELLKEYVDYAIRRDAVLLVDAAYEAFVRDPGLPTSIYEIEGAKQCAIELSSLSKTAGFTGTRCGYTVVPQELMREGVSLNKYWLRRQTTKFNGVSYVIQRGAEAVFSETGYAQAMENVDYYLENAALLREGLSKLGIWFVGGQNSPYVWLKCPDGLSSWEYFDKLLNEVHVVGTPGAGFGQGGEGFFRLTAFGKREDVEEAMQRLSTLRQ